MRLYISGPMTGLPENNFPAFFEAERILLDAGYEVENPATKGIVEGWAWVDYLKYDLAVLLPCDGVAVLPGWENSRGALLELHVAEALLMPIKSIEDWASNRIATPARLVMTEPGISP
jgi:hypothetical protein